MSTINTSSWRWFIRGWFLGALACGTANAASYFVRSPSWSQLWRRPPGETPAEAIGFPWKVWEGGNNYGGYFVDYPLLLANLGVACCCGLLMGVAVWTQRRRLNQLVARWETEQPQREGSDKLQFSMRAMLLWTIVAALVCAMLRRLFTSDTAKSLTGDQGEMLLATIYMFGPWLLVAAALAPRGLAWQHRVGLIIPLTFGLIAFAIGVGNLSGMSVENVMLGIVVCWTPQAMFAAVALTTGLLVSHYVLGRRRPSTGAST